MSTPSAGYTTSIPRLPQRSHSSPSTFDKGKWVEPPSTVGPPRVDQTSPSSPAVEESSHHSQPVIPTADTNIDSTELPTITTQKDSTANNNHHNTNNNSETLKTRISATLHALFPCFLSTRPKYTKIQHLVIPTSQICVDSRSLRFLQTLPQEQFHLLNYIVQEVFTDDGVKLLGRIPDYDDLIEKGLKGVVRTAERPWVNVQREGYVESLAGLYARLLRKLGTYERAEVCERVYERKYRKKGGEGRGRV
ncbi:hypothetical protein AA313_de0205346 [Arthrobotrys entomopaga]|nr:hypothetical protein AA313_de0205346 [Arthrobotrys entomopaga]